MKELLGLRRRKALNHTPSILRVALHVQAYILPVLPLTYRNPSAIISLVRICALPAGVLSRRVPQPSVCKAAGFDFPDVLDLALAPILPRKALHSRKLLRIRGDQRQFPA